MKSTSPSLALAIDLGTTSICGVALDTENGKVLRSITKNSNAFITDCAPFERIQSVDKIIRLAFEILDELMTEGVCAIGVTGQMHGILYLDKDGNAVSPLYTWQDGRGNLPYKDTTYAAHLGASTGYGNVTDFYNRENSIRPENAVRYCTIHDYLVMKLCNLSEPLIHASDAASFGCFDLVENRFVGYDCDVKVTADTAIAGEYKGIPVSVAIGDNQASVLSCISEGDVLLNVGTGSQVSVITDKIVKGTDIETRPFFEGKYLTVGAALCGGRAYSILKDFYASVLGYRESLDESEVYKIMDEMLKDKSSAPLVADTRFAGTRADSTITGSITGITDTNFTPGNLTHAILSGMTEELYGMYCGMKDEKCGLVGSGNGIRRNAALVDISEKRFGLKMRIPAHTEEASVGAALFALVACGRFSSIKEAQSLIKYID